MAGYQEGCGAATLPRRPAHFSIALPNGRRTRCHGDIGSDGKYAHGTREDLAGRLPEEEGHTFAHRLDDP